MLLRPPPPHAVMVRWWEKLVTAEDRALGVRHTHKALGAAVLAHTMARL
eukprot:gene3011-36959_t